MTARLKVRTLSGFTLLELAVVIVIIGILAAIAIPTFRTVIGNSNDASVATTMSAVARDAQSIYKISNGSSTQDWYDAYATATAETPATASAAIVLATATHLALSINPAPADATPAQTYAAAVTSYGGTSSGDGKATSTGLLSVSVSDNLIGMAQRSTSGNCVMGTASTTGTSVTTWNMARDLGTNCAGSVALQGKTATKADIAALVAGGAAPTSWTLSSAPYGRGTVDLSWDPMYFPDNIDYANYQIEFQDPLATDPTAWAVVNDTSFVDQFVGPNFTSDINNSQTEMAIGFPDSYLGRSLKIRVNYLSYNDNSSKGLSNEITVQLPTTAIMAPTTAPLYASLDVRWGEVSANWHQITYAPAYVYPVTGYRVYADIDGVRTLLLQTGDTNNGILVPPIPLALHTLYTFHFLAFGPGGEGPDLSATSEISNWEPVGILYPDWYVYSAPTSDEISARVAAVVNYNALDATLPWSPNYSTNPGGFNQTGSSGGAVAYSLDGTKIVIVDYGTPSQAGGYIYTSTDSGATWTQRASARDWQSVASSSDGTILLATVGSDLPGHGIYRSEDSGVTWTQVSTTGGNLISMSADGAQVVVGTSYARGSNIFVSHDTGSTFQTESPGGTVSLNAVAVTSDGSATYVRSVCSIVGNGLSCGSGYTAGEEILLHH